MNDIAIAMIAFGLLAFPICLIGVTALARGTMISGRSSRNEEAAHARYQGENKK